MSSAVIIKRRTKKGKLRYGVRVDRAGGQVWVGTRGTLAEARQLEAQAKTARTVTTMRCEEFVAYFLEGYEERVKDSSYDVGRAALRKFAQDFRGIPLSRVTVVEAERWARQNRWRVPVVVTLFNAAVKRELVNRNPFAGLSQKGEGRKRITPPTIEQVDLLAATADRVHGDFGPTMRALVLFLAYSGMRPGEVFPLEWADLDFKAMRIHVERRLYKGSLDLPKSNRPRQIVLAPPARNALLHLPRDSRLVFTGKRGGRFSQSLLTWYWQPIVAAFPRKIQPYELRHFAAHHLYVTMGLPARVVAAQLGHDGPKLIEDLYGHGDVGALEELDRAWGRNVRPLRKASGE